MIQSYYSRYGEVKGDKRGRDSLPLVGELLLHHRRADQFAPGAGLAARADPAGLVVDRLDASTMCRRRSEVTMLSTGGKDTSTARIAHPPGPVVGAGGTIRSSSSGIRSSVSSPATTWTA